MRLTLSLAAVLAFAPAAAAESHAAFWRAEAERAGAVAPLPRVGRVPPGREHVKQIVADEARRQLGAQWVSTALRIAYVESRFNPGAVGPKTRHGRAQGVMQVMPGSARALGYNPARLREARYGAAAGVAHMKACLASGVRTERQMAACHVSGVAGWKTRLARGSERYKRQYVAMVVGTR